MGEVLGEPHAADASAPRLLGPLLARPSAAARAARARPRASGSKRDGVGQLVERRRARTAARTAASCGRSTAPKRERPDSSIRPRSVSVCDAGLGVDAADPGDLRPRDRLQVGDDRERLGLRLGQRRRARLGQQAPGGVLGDRVGRRACSRRRPRAGRRRAGPRRAPRPSSVERAVDLGLGRPRRPRRARRPTTGSGERKSSASIVRGEIALMRSPPPSHGASHLDRAEVLASGSRSPRPACASRAARTASPPGSAGPRRRTPRRSRTRGGAPSSSRRTSSRRSSETVGRMWLVSGAGGSRSRSPSADAEPLGLVDGAAPPRARPGAAPAAAAPSGTGSARPASKQLASARRRRGSGGTRASARAARRRPPRARARARSSSACGSISRDFSSSSAAIRTRNSVAASRSSSPALLEVLDVGDDDLAELDLEQADLLAQDERHQQVEGPGEDVEVELELGGAHRASDDSGQRRSPTAAVQRRRADAHRLAHVGERRPPRSRAPCRRPSASAARAPPRRRAARRSARAPARGTRRPPRRRRP